MSNFHCLRKQNFGETCEYQCEVCVNTHEGYKQKKQTIKRRKRIDYILTFLFLIGCLTLPNVIESKSLSLFAIIVYLLCIMKVSDYNNRV